MPTIEIPVDDVLLAKARRAAYANAQSVEELATEALKEHLEYLAAVAGMPRFSLDAYVMQRDTGETDAEYSARLGLFL